MEQNTNAIGMKKSAGKETTPKAAFAISSYFTPTTIHIAAEVIIACAFFVYFQKKINKQKAEYDQRIEALETRMEELVSGSQKQFIAPKPQVQPQPPSQAPKPQSQAPKPQVQPPPQANIAMSFFQDFMKGSGAGSLFDGQKPPPLSTIEEVVEDSDGGDDVKPISSEQLDKELSEELGELSANP